MRSERLAHTNFPGAWVLRAVDATQVLAGAFLSPRFESLEDGLAQFERMCPSPRGMAECLILRAILLDVFFHLETVLEDKTQSAQRLSARKRLLHAAPADTLRAFLETAHQLVTEADLALSLPVSERARRWINEHLHDHRTVRELAALLGTHPRTLSRQFTADVGMTLQQYRWQVRTMRAAELLSTSDMKVEAVAEAVGVRSKSTLYRLMRRFGQTPRRREREAIKS